MYNHVQFLTHSSEQTITADYPYIHGSYVNSMYMDGSNSGGQFFPVQPALILALDNIQSTSTIGTYHYEWEPWDLDQYYTGHVTFTAGKSIKLLPGFQVKDDAYFHAIIDLNVFDCMSSKSLIIHIDDKGIKETDEQMQALKFFEEKNDTESDEHNFQDALSVSIYPNPTQGTINFWFSQPNIIGSVQINNTLGNTIMTWEIQNSKLSINITGQPKGIYFIRIIANGESFEEKLILQ